MYALSGPDERRAMTMHILEMKDVPFGVPQSHVSIPSTESNRYSQQQAMYNATVFWCYEAAVVQSK